MVQELSKTPNRSWLYFVAVGGMTIGAGVVATPGNVGSWGGVFQVVMSMLVVIVLTKERYSGDKRAR